MTTDFFTPVVDDPYQYGAIAAANALSDVYAMGATPFLALSIAALPPDLPVELSSEIIRGGAEKVKEAGAVIAGGHTIQDKEPKFGLVVLGKVNPQRIFTKAGLKPGDHLVLTKPLGFGVTTTALKRDRAEYSDVTEVVDWMMHLNKIPAEVGGLLDLKAATDVTGFSLIGHSWEMALGSDVGLRLVYDQIPFLAGAKKYADAWMFPGGAVDNRNYFSERVSITGNLTDAEQMLLFDPQTSGGLLLGVPDTKLNQFVELCKSRGEMTWVVGEVTTSGLIEVVGH